MSRLIVKNLPKTINETRLKDAFSSQGKITDVQLKFTKEGVFRQFAFVGYKTEEEAALAAEYFNNTFLDTSRIKVELCNSLGDEKKPRAWSKYAADSSAIQKKNTESKKCEKNSDVKTTDKEKKKKSGILEKYKEDKDFLEFLEVNKHKSKKKLWGNDDAMEGGAPGGETEKQICAKTKNKKAIVYDDDTGDSESGSDLDDPENDAGKNSEPANKVSSDSGVSEDEAEKQPGKKSKKKREVSNDFTVKLLQISLKCKRSNIRQFFKPLKPVSIRQPPRNKGIAYVQFSSETEVKQALVKDKSFIDNKQVRVKLYAESKTEAPENGDNKEAKWKKQAEEVLNLEESIAESGRLFVRNLSYSCTEKDVDELFSKYGQLTEVSVPIDHFTKRIKALAFVTFVIPENAVKAFTDLDGTVFQGRLLHILPAQPPRNDKTKNKDGESLTSYKKTKDAKMKEQSSSSHNWNSLFLGTNVVADVLANKYKASKKDVLGVETGENVAVRMALGETQIVNETRDFLIQNGVDLDMFSQPAAPRSKDTILAKNLPSGTTQDEIRQKFETFGDVSRVLLPPSGVTAIVEFIRPQEAQAAFKALAYTRFKTTPLLLEWAPVKVFTTEYQPQPPAKAAVANEAVAVVGSNPVAAAAGMVDSSDDEKEEPVATGATLYVKNLNFSTDDDALNTFFSSVGKVRSATVSKKKDMRKPGSFLSMGYGFVQFQTAADAQLALKRLQHSSLDGHTLELKMSNREASSKPASETTSRKKATPGEQVSSKILVKNIPFEATTRDVSKLFSTFGEVKSVRLPKKIDGSHRGFGFVEFLARHDAKKAFKALIHSTHLYGRRLVLEWAENEENVDAMRKKTAEHFFEGPPSKRSKKGLASMDDLEG